ncbi:MAG: hypothetical protein LBF89_12540 [Bacteroidales bacterium]|jgi:hypothetical protein|nr:hypothetical protein [Bacteroidales bacterium]
MKLISKKSNGKCENTIAIFGFGGGSTNIAKNLTNLLKDNGFIIVGIDKPLEKIMPVSEKSN